MIPTVSGAIRNTHANTLPWRDPIDVAAAFADEPWALALISDGVGERGRWSYVLRQPEETFTGDRPIASLAALLGGHRSHDPHGPPFQGGLAGLMGYSLGSEAARHPDWPELACARYGSLLAFDHADRRVHAIGPGAADWLKAANAPLPFAGSMLADLQRPDGPTYEAAVAEVVARIGAGEIYQANIARAWTGWLTPIARPFDLARRLTRQSPAPFAAYLRLPGRALVSNSPERFIHVSPTASGLMAETRPIKGTAPRSADPAEDCALAHALRTSLKDRAENLMIVDLMRNDLARVCAPGGVRTPELWRVETFANVHHLVSTVTGQLQRGKTALDLMEAAFPPGSITGAPKIQAIRVIEGLEPARGPFFGAMFWAGFDGALDSNVLIRTATFVEDGGGWRWEARAGAGLVADSEPVAERLETETKISALLAALQA